MATPFVGRDDELRSLLELCTRAPTDGPVAATIVGQPGIGKSRLLAEAIEQAQMEALAGAGFELARDVPFSAASGILRGLAGTPTVGAPLEALLFGTTTPSGGPESLRIFETAYRCLAAGGPRLLCLDDVHWADDGSLALIDYLVRACVNSSTPVAILLAGRPSASSDRITAQLARALGPDRRLDLQLDPLGPEDGMRLARALSEAVDGAAAREIWRTAQGSPFWIELLSRSNAVRSASDLLDVRLRTLDGDASALLAMLVVAGRPVLRADEADLMRWPHERAQRAERRLVDGGLASLSGPTIALAHDLVREAAVASLPPRELARLHVRIAEHTERSAGDDIQALTEALEHRRAAGGDAGSLARRLARSPQRRLLGDDGLMLLAQVGRDEADLELLGDVGRLAKELGRWEVALDAATTVSERASDRSVRSRAALDAAEAAYELQRAGEAMAFLRASRRSASGDELVAIEADARESQVLRWLENRVDEAQAPTARAVAAGRSVVERAGGLERLTDDERRACLAAMRAELDAALRAADAATAIRVADEIGLAAREPREVFAASFDALLVVTFFDGTTHGVDRRARALVDEARRLGLPAAEAEAMLFLSIALYGAGKLDEAEDAIETTIELVERAGPPERFPAGDIHGLRGRIALSRHPWHEGMRSLIEHADGEPDAHVRLNLERWVVWALARFATDRADELDARLEVVRRDAEAAACERCGWETVLQDAEVHARLGRTSEARALLQRWDEAHPCPLPGPAMERAHIEALVLAAEDPGSAPAAFLTAEGLAGRAGRTYDGFWIRLDATRLRAETDPAGAVAELERLADEADHMGATSEGRLLRQILRSMGVRAWRRASRRGEPLTEREAEVARLAAAGASNPEIASAMFVSRKTVERHISNVLRKLGARNRTELATLLARPDAQEVEGAPR